MEEKKKKKRGRKPLPPAEREARIQAYQSRYYDTNRARISRQRKMRKMLGVSERKAGKGYVEAKFDIDGRIVTGYSIGYVAKCVGVGTSQLLSWRQKGVLPESPWRTNRGQFYTQEQIAAINVVLSGMRAAASDGNAWTMERLKFVFAETLKSTDGE